MDLSERKKQILKAIVSDYIRTAEPIGSKTIANRPELQFSSATIRNEMSELEELGYLEKPHTSAGRVPSPQGYRLYVDELMEKVLASDKEDDLALYQTLQHKVQKLDGLIHEAGRLIANLTDYATVVTTPALSKAVLRQFEIVVVDSTTFVLVAVPEMGDAKSKMVHTKQPVSREEAELLTYVLNQTVTGIPLSSITAERMDVVRRAAGLTALLSPVATYLAELMESMQRSEIFLEGGSKLLKYPEYHDTKQAKALLDYLGDTSNQLVPIGQFDGVKILIGPENGETPLASASVIYAQYDIGELGQGILGLVGPTRMDYATLSARLRCFAKGLNRLVRDIFLEEKSIK